MPATPLTDEEEFVLDGTDPDETERSFVESICRDSFPDFVREAWHVLEPGVELEWNWHHTALCLEIQHTLEGWLVAHNLGSPEMRARQERFWEMNGLTFREGELLVQNWLGNVPPVTLKSRILMVFAPAWMWLWCPHWSLCAISSVDENVRRDSIAHRDLVSSAWYRETFQITWEIRGDADAIAKWANTAGGERLSRMLLGGSTGVHVDCILLDDPDDAHRVHSEPVRRETKEKWTRGWRNRLKHPNRSQRMAIQQRTHVDDWTANAVGKSRWSPTKRKGWAQFCLPLRFGRGPADAPKVTPFGWTDPRTEPDQCLHPARFTEDVIADEMTDRGTAGFGGQYDQNPQPLDGGMIKHGWMRFFRIEDEEFGTRPRPHGCLGSGGEFGTVEQHPAYVLKRRADGSLDLDWMTLTVDATFGSIDPKTASSVGLLVVGGKGQRRFVFDDRTKPMTLKQTKAAIRDLIATWPIKRVLVELKANGKSVIDDMRDELAEGVIVEVDGAIERHPICGPDGLPATVVLEAVTDVKDSKEARANAMVGAYEAGFVFVMDGAPWLYATRDDEGHVGEICTFPESKKDDRIDAMSQLMTKYRIKKVPRKASASPVLLTRTGT